MKKNKRQPVRAPSIFYVQIKSIDFELHSSGLSTSFQNIELPLAVFSPAASRPNAQQSFHLKCGKTLRLQSQDRSRLSSDGRAERQNFRGIVDQCSCLFSSL
jgi:hypothetical protein